MAPIIQWWTEFFLSAGVKIELSSFCRKIDEHAVWVAFLSGAWRMLSPTSWRWTPFQRSSFVWSLCSNAGCACDKLLLPKKQRLRLLNNERRHSGSIFKTSTKNSVGMGISEFKTHPHGLLNLFFSIVVHRFRKLEWIPVKPQTCEKKNRYF